MSSVIVVRRVPSAVQSCFGAPAVFASLVIIDSTYLSVAVLLLDCGKIHFGGKYVRNLRRALVYMYIRLCARQSLYLPCCHARNDICAYTNNVHD